MEKQYTCKICHSPTTLFIKDIFDDRYGYPKLFDIYKCTACKSFITEPPMPMSEIEALYTNYYPRKNITSDTVKKRAAGWKKQGVFMQWLSGEHRIHRIFPKAPHSGIKVLDVGCGDGSSLLELQSLGYTAYGIETDSNLEKIKHELDLTIFIGILEHSPFAKHSFDYVIANQVIEHVVDLENFAKGIAQFLKPGGTAVVSTPNSASIFRMIYGRTWLHWHIPYHQQIMSVPSVKNLFKKHGLVHSNSITVSPSSWTVHEINRLRIKPVLGEKNPFWNSDPNEGSAPTRKTGSRIIGKILRKILFLFMAAIGKIANTFGYGNCMIVTLKAQ